MITLEDREDLDFLYHALLKHPLFIRNPEKQELFALLFMQMKQEDELSLVEKATKLTCFFEDGHTNIELSYTSVDKCLPIKCSWSENGATLLLKEPLEDIPAGSQIIQLEGKDIDSLILQMAERIPHENIFLVKSRMIEYPYRNYHVFSAENLKALFGEKEQYPVTFSVHGQSVVKNIPLQAYDGFLDFPEEKEFISFEVRDKKVILYLRECIYNETYVDTLKKIADVCEKENCDTLILDLSHNMGGNSSVIEEFIQYTHVKKYKLYAMIDYSLGQAKRIVSSEDWIENKQKEKLFPQKIFCKVSYSTFSSARTFAVTLKDNGIAEIIGKETGGKPNSFGMSQRMILPNSHIRFRVSRCWFERPDKRREKEETLKPTLNNSFGIF